MRIQPRLYQLAMVNSEEAPAGDITEKIEMTASQRIFKYVNIVLLVILLYCVPGFLAFRKHVLELGFHSFKVDSLSWCLLGFVGIFILKYTYYWLMRDTIDGILHVKYTGPEREYKLKALLKFSIDTVFYSCMTFMAYYLFRDEYWFPWPLGGNGSCSDLYKEYPNWPSASANKLQIYYMVQLGVHSFSVFEMIVIKRGTQRKYYEYLLHHCVAMNLILFSMMCNETAAGASIVIAHDISDIFAAFGRGFVQTKFEIKKLNITLYIVMTTVWIYTRHVVYPLCLLSNVWFNRPSPTDSWRIVNFEYLYLLGMAVVLECMHVFWTYFLLQVGLKEVKWQRIINIHEEKKH